MVKNKFNNLNEKEIQNLEIINKCGQNLIYLINDMLALSKIDTKNIDLENKTINIKDTITRNYIKFEKLAKEKGLIINLHMDESLDFIFSDEIKINQIIKNLLSNALKFSHKGAISFFVKDMQNEIKILIEDEGIGIEDNKFDYIFDRFTQIDSSIRRKYGGIGLGLAICKELVLLLNGKISVKSKLHQGTSFEVILPKNIELINLNEINIQKENLQLETNHKISDSKFNMDFDIKIEEKNKVLVLNNDHLLFFNLIIELKKKYDVKQVLTFAELLKYNNEFNCQKIILDFSKLNEEEKKLLLTNLSNNFIILYDNENDLEILKKIECIFMKPLTKELIKNIIL
jgi:two-component sensor histidine kinase